MPRTWTLTLAALTVAALTTGPVRADKLPGKMLAGEDVLDRYVEVTGGKEAYEKFHNRVSRGTMELPALGLKGKATLYQAAPGKMYMDADLPGIGKIEEGTDGHTVWEKSTAGGARVKKGEEGANALRAAAFNSDVNWRKVYAKAETLGLATADGKACYKVKLTTPEGQVRTNYYDHKTGLLVKAESREKTQAGELPTEALVDDYKKVDGILMPHRLREKVLTQEFVLTFEKIEHNVELPADRFDLPADIKKLAAREQGGKK